MNSLRLISFILIGWLVCGPLARAEEGVPIVAAGYEAVGLSPYPMTSRGYRIAYGATATSEVEIATMSAERTVLLAEINLQETELRYRSWLSEIAYAGVGLGWRRVDLVYDVFVAEGAPAEHVVERHRMATATAHFGVEVIRLGWLVVGSDLFGASVPIYKSEDKDEFPAGAEDYEEDPKVYPYIKNALGMSYQLVRTYVAVRF